MKNSSGGRNYYLRRVLFNKWYSSSVCKLFFAAIVFALIIYTPVSGQGTATGTGYQMTMMNNPSLSGRDGTGSLRLSYLNFFPGNSYNLHSVYLSYDSYFQLLHGGAAFFLSDDYLGGIVNDMRAGVSYSYFLRAGDDVYINAGLSGSVIRRGYNFSGAILPDQIDPLGSISVPSSEVLSSQGKTLFDLGAGFSFISGKISGGISVVHLSEPSFSVTGLTEERLKRTVFVHLTGDLLLTRDKSLRIRPLFFSELRKDNEKPILK